MIEPAAPVRWGILGTGTIAAAFAEALALLPDARLVAVGSRAAASAEAFGARFSIPRRHASYEALAADPDVDVVHVATPNGLHRGHALLCLEAGKAVLCEKPLAVTAREAADMVGCARRRGLFLMEAMWTRFLPVVREVRERVAAGAIGRPLMLAADFGFAADSDAGILFDPALGGGALLDVGVYGVSLSSWLLGRPDRIAALATLGPSGVDETIAATLGFPGGALASIEASICAETAQEATVTGTAGRIRLHAPWWRASRATLVRAGRADEEIVRPFEGSGYQLEAAEVGRCLRAGKRESEVMPLDESVSIMETLDAIRERGGHPLDAGNV